MKLSPARLSGGESRGKRYGDAADVRSHHGPLARKCRQHARSVSDAVATGPAYSCQTVETVDRHFFALGRWPRVCNCVRVPPEHIPTTATGLSGTLRSMDNVVGCRSMSGEEPAHLLAYS